MKVSQKYNKLYMVLLGVVTYFSAASYSSAVVIDFDDVASGTEITNQYAGLGVTFSGLVNPVTDDTNSAFYGPLASGNVLLADGGDANTGGGYIDLFFSSVGSFSVDLIFLDTGNTATIDVYDSSNLLIDSRVSNVDTGLGDDQRMFVSYLEETEIAWARISFITGDQIVGIDNLTLFAPVPEPSSILLLGLGLLSLSRLVKTKKV